MQFTSACHPVQIFAGSHFKRSLALSLLIQLLPLFLLNLQDTEENINFVFPFAKIPLTVLFGLFRIVCGLSGVAHMPLEQDHKGPQNETPLKDLRFFFLTFVFYLICIPKHAVSDFFHYNFLITSMHTKFR